MIGPHSYFRRIYVTAVTVCALFFTVAANADGDWEQQLQERSRSYLQSLETRSADLPVDLRERIAENARRTVKNGFAKLNRPSVLIRKHVSAPMDPSPLAEVFRTVGREPGRHAAAFLAQGFYRPAELDVAVRVALPSRYHWERRFGILAAHRPFSKTVSTGFGAMQSGSDMIIAPTLRRDAKTWAFVLGQFSFTTVSGPLDAVDGRFAEDANLLTGYPPIAGTIVLRI